jgi:hypothetical protein
VPQKTTAKLGRSNPLLVLVTRQDGESSFVRYIIVRDRGQFTSLFAVHLGRGKEIKRKWGVIVK